MRRYVRGINLISINAGANKSYYLFNAHGDVVQLSDAAGAVTQTYDYDAFGNQNTETPTDTNPFRYCGEYYDAGTGTIYLRARYYDPSVGRFTQQDPVGDGLNWYTYCENNPIKFIDPLGLVRMGTKTMLDELGIDIYSETEDTIFAQCYNKDYGGVNLHFLYHEMDSADFAKMIGLDNRFGSYNSEITEKEALLYLRSEFASILLNNNVDSFSLNPKKHYLLDCNGHTIQMQMESDSINVNMELGDAGDILLSSDRYELAQWLKDTYKLQYQRNYPFGTHAIGEELYWHSWAFRNTKPGSYWSKHARTADMGDTYSLKSHWWERAACDVLGGLSSIWN